MMDVKLDTYLLADTNQGGETFSLIYWETQNYNEQYQVKSTEKSLILITSEKNLIFFTYMFIV